MKSGWRVRLNRPWPKHLPSGWGSVLKGMSEAVVVLLTLWIAVALSLREQPLVASLEHLVTATSTVIIPTLAIIGPVAPVSPTASPVASSIPSASPGSSATAEPSPSPTQKHTASPVATCRAPAGWQPYVVKRGESFRSIAQRFGTSEGRLKQANCLDSAAVAYAGQRIYVPREMPSPTVACSKASDWVRYTIQPGDTLFSIAVRYGVTLSYLKKANCLSADLIYAGEVLLVPYYLPAGATSAAGVIVPHAPNGTPTPGNAAVRPPTATSSTPSRSPTNTPSPTKETAVATSMAVAPTATPSATSTPTPTPTPTPTEAPGLPR
jgi:LysM repeat protein